jgi:predicted nucleic acid-binding protein
MDDERRKENKHLAISTISKIEVLSLQELHDEQIEQIEKFLDVFGEISLHDEVVYLAAALRRKERISLGDAIILASALQRGSILVTNDKKLLHIARRLSNATSVK